MVSLELRACLPIPRCEPLSKSFKALADWSGHRAWVSLTLQLSGAVSFRRTSCQGVGVLHSRPCNVMICCQILQWWTTLALDCVDKIQLRPWVLDPSRTALMPSHRQVKHARTNQCRMDTQNAKRKNSMTDVLDIFGWCVCTYIYILWFVCHTAAYHAIYLFPSCCWINGRELSRDMPDGSVVRPGFVRWWPVGTWTLISPTNIGSGAESPLPGAWVLLAEHLRPGLALWHLPLQLSSHVGDTVRCNYIPLFSNKPQDYKEWRKRIRKARRPRSAFWHPWREFHGDRWSTWWTKEDETGFDQVLVQLDKRFKYDDCVEMPRAPEKMEKFWHGSTRRGDQSLMQYCADHREARRNLEKHKITLPYTASGWLLLRRSSLTYEQRQMVQMQCASLEEVKVEEAMYYHVLPLRPRLSWTQRRSMGSQCTIKLHQRWPPRQHADAVGKPARWMMTSSGGGHQPGPVPRPRTPSMRRPWTRSMTPLGRAMEPMTTLKRPTTSLMSCVATMMKRWKSLLGRKAPTRQSSCCPKVLARCGTCSWCSFWWCSSSTPSFSWRQGGTMPKWTSKGNSSTSIHFNVWGNWRKSTTKTILNAHTTGSTVAMVCCPRPFRGQWMECAQFWHLQWMGFWEGSSQTCLPWTTRSWMPWLQLVCAPMQEVVNSPELEPPHPGSDRGLGSWTWFSRSHPPAACLLSRLHETEAWRTPCCLEQTRQHLGPVPVWHHAPGQLWRLDVHQEAHDAAMAFVSSCRGNDKALHGRSWTSSNRKLKPEDLQPSTSFWSLSTRLLQCHLWHGLQDLWGWVWRGGLCQQRCATLGDVPSDGPSEPWRCWWQCTLRLMNPELWIRSTVPSWPWWKSAIAVWCTTSTCPSPTSASEKKWHLRMELKNWIMRWVTFLPSPWKIDGKQVTVEGHGPESTTSPGSSSLCLTCSTARFPSTCSRRSASLTSAEEVPVLGLWWSEMNGMALMLTARCTNGWTGATTFIVDAGLLTSVSAAFPKWWPTFWRRWRTRWSYSPFSWTTFSVSEPEHRWWWWHAGRRWWRSRSNCYNNSGTICRTTRRQCDWTNGRTTWPTIHTT